jgi:dTDP-4-dehydrorhamnose reductase
MKERILVVGASGLIGQELTYQLFHKEYDVVAGINSQSILPKIPRRETRIDLLSEESVKKVISSESPDVIINLAAMSGIIKCEEKKGSAHDLNVMGVKYLVEFAGGLPQRRPFFIHFSTDHVFNGFDGITCGYKEDDSTKPSNYYGETKLESEKIVRDSSLDTLIVRTSLNFGNYRYKERQDRLHSMVMRKVRNGEYFKVKPDSIVSPTYLEYLCEGVLFLLEKGVRNETVHIAGRDALSKFEFARRIAMLLDPIYDSMITVSDNGPIKDTSLNTEKMLNLGYPQMSINDALNRYKRRLKKF